MKITATLIKYISIRYGEQKRLGLRRREKLDAPVNIIIADPSGRAV
jgi:hypothetical protein